jgi:cholesterol oxidase
MTGRYDLRFTEEMKGWFSYGEREYQPGRDRGRADGSSLMFHLTIAVGDVHRFIADAEHTAQASGWIESDALGGRLPVEQGIFNLFVTHGPRGRRMLYRLFFEDAVGHPLTLSGFKEISGGTAVDVWPETSTLYVRVLQGYVESGEEQAATVVGSGILRIPPLAFIRQVTTFRVQGPDLPGRARALLDFVRLFAGQLVALFLWPSRRVAT